MDRIREHRSKARSLRKLAELLYDEPLKRIALGLARTHARHALRLSRRRRAPSSQNR